jgi:hypothetical protein
MIIKHLFYYCKVPEAVHARPQGPARCAGLAAAGGGLGRAGAGAGGDGRIRRFTGRRRSVCPAHAGGRGESPAHALQWDDTRLPQHDRADQADHAPCDLLSKSNRDYLAVFRAGGGRETAVFGDSCRQTGR